MTTPGSLLQRLHESRDPDAWSRLVQLYLPLICYWARRAGLQDADVDDLCQEVFTSLVRILPEFTYDRHKSFRSWLRTVTLNKWREMNRRRVVPTAGNDAAKNLADPADADQLWDEEHNRYVAHRALQLMRADFDANTWQACWATVVDDRKPAEVAAELGVTIATVYAAKSRVLRRLRQELDGLF